MKLLLGMGMAVTVLAGCGAAEKSGQTAGDGDSAAEESVRSGGDDAANEMDGSDAAEEHDETDGDVQTDDADDARQSADEETEILHLEGAGLSILGDSISTFDGWIPEGFNVFYPLSGEVTDVSQTWWKLLMDNTGMELCANGSSSGSTCVGDSMSEDNPWYGCSGYRISFLTGAGGRMPDVIIVYLGTNDLLMSVPLGDNDGTNMVEEGEIENFSDAYCMILDKLASDYPAAQVYCCNLTQVGDWGTGEGQAFVPFVNGLGLTAEDYSKQIQIIADNKGIPVIDLYHCGIETANLREMTTDGVHPTPKGMKCLGDAVLKGMGGSPDR